MSLEARIEQHLKDKSRSFYWALKLLPASLQVPLALTYVIAREADDIVDDVKLGRQERVDKLQRLNTAIHQGNESTGLPMADAALLALRKEAGSEILKNLLKTLLGAMRFDLERVEGGSPLNDSEIEAYLDQIAGCVGVAWTDLALLKAPELYVSDPRPHALRFGRALQRVNILRDIWGDHLRSRYYFGFGPETLLQEDLATKIESRSEQWSLQTLRELKSAVAYIRCVNPNQKQYAMALFSPAVLAFETLELLKERKDLRQHIKIPRSDVYLWLLKAWRIEKELVLLEQRIDQRLRGA